MAAASNPKPIDDRVAALEAGHTELREAMRRMRASQDTLARAGRETRRQVKELRELVVELPDKISQQLASQTQELKTDIAEGKAEQSAATAAMVVQVAGKVPAWANWILAVFTTSTIGALLDVISSHFHGPHVH